MKNVFKKIVSLVLVSVLSLAFTACKQNGDYLQHEHTYANNYSSDDTHHWYKATCSHKDAVNGKEEHDYDANFKCKVCDYSHTHKFSDAFLYNETYHWNNATCGHSVKNQEEHNFNGDNECDDCGYAMHVHTFSSEYSYDENYHYKEATCEHSEEVLDKAMHNLDANYQCVICDYVHTHTFADEYSYNETYHYYLPTCGHNVTNQEEHNFNGDYECDDCGYNSHVHTFSSEYSYNETYHYKEATCGHSEEVLDKAMHTLDANYQCTTCDYVHTHTFADEYSYNETHHYKEATCGHDVPPIQKEEHEYSYELKCITCNQVHNHTYPDNYSFDENGHWKEATCGHSSANTIPVAHTLNENYACIKCDFIHNHTFESTLSKNETYHWYESTCGHDVQKDKTPHVYDVYGSCSCGYYDESKSTVTELYVATYEGGWGKAWLETMAREFEEIYKDYSFEPNHKGIKIHIKGGKSDVTGDAVKSLMSTSNYDVYFTTYKLRENVLEGRLMDITDVVNNTMDAKYNKVWKDLGETKTIAEKMDGAIKDYVLYATADSKGNVDTANTRYYGIPMYTSFYNINYDIDLFYEKGYYLKEDGNFCGRTKGSGKVTEDVINGQKSLGQDGIKGTEDDGLPITFDDFKKVCAKMVNDGVSPMCWSGNVDAYRIGYFNNFHANYEGAEDWYINVTGEGVDAEILDGNNQPIQMTVEARNGWNTAKQRGRLAALSFAEMIIKNNWWDSDASNGTDHTSSQDKFLMSKRNSEKGGKRIAMLIEGGWWENEAKATIETMANQYGGEYVNRRFGVMTYPRFDNGHHTTTKYKDANGNYTLDEGAEAREVNDMTLVSITPDSNVAIRKNAKQPEAAKLFLAYTTTDKCLRTYTRMTGSTRPYDYELTEDDFAEMSEFKQQLWGYYRRAIKAGNVRYISGPGRFGELNPQIVTGTYGVASWGVVVNEINVNMLEPLRIFQTYGAQDGFTAQAYFDAYVAYYTADNGAIWKAKFCKNL